MLWSLRVFLDVVMALRHAFPVLRMPAAVLNPVLGLHAVAIQLSRIAPATRRTYSSGVRSLVRFARAHGVGGDIFPCSEELLQLWVTYWSLPPKAKTYGTIRVYMSGVVNFHLEFGHRLVITAMPTL